MTQKIRITLEIDATPWSEERISDEGGFSAAELAFINDGELGEQIDPQALGECIASLFFEDSDASNEALAGSGMFVDLGAAKCVDATVLA